MLKSVVPGGQDQDMMSVYSDYLEEQTDVLPNLHDRGGKGRSVNINPKPIINSLDKVVVPISLTLTAMVGYICGGAILFKTWEGKLTFSHSHAVMNLLYFENLSFLFVNLYLHPSTYN